MPKITFDSDTLDMAFRARVFKALDTSPAPIHHQSDETDESDRKDVISIDEDGEAHESRKLVREQTERGKAKMNRRRTHRWTRKREGPTDTSGEQTNNIRADVAMTVRWEQFLCGKIKDSKMRELVTKILGTNARPGSKAYEREYQFVLNLCRRQRSTTLARAAKFVREMVQGDGDSRGAWANWCDPRVKYTDDVLREKIRSAWSWPRFYAIWHWFYRCADGEANTKLARYYCQQLWESIIFETIHYLRVMELSPGKVKEAQKRRNAVYVALPSHEHFAKVRRELFFERNISPEKKEKLDIAATLSHVVIPPPPSDDEELNDGDEEDYEDEDEEYEDD